MDTVDVDMNENDELAAAGDALPELPAHAVARLAVGNQVDFEIEFYRGILDRDPNYLEVLRVLGNNLAAKGMHGDGLEIDRRIVRLRPLDKVALYNLACSYAMLGMVDSSLESLKAAVDAGYDEFEYMRLDSELEATRRDPRFHELLAEMGVRSSSQG